MAGTYHGMSCKGLCRCVSRNIQARRKCVQVLDGVRGGRCHCTWLEVDTEACGTKLDTTKLTWARNLIQSSMSWTHCGAF
ncbi:hypothetical protein CY35_15G009200 [Sphagnum magellanicum]|nr:hypothetical protein CY35_15G009200 [Sphagnum magellanicum]